MIADDDPLHASSDTANRLNLTDSTLATWRSKGKGPPWVKVGRSVYYRESAIREWLRAQERTSTRSAA